MAARRPVFLILSIAVFIAMLYVFWDYSIDDAFITFTYAENLADGHGLVFNTGDKPVEGYSNFLWMIVLSGLYYIGLPPYLTAKILGVVFVILTIFLWYRYFNSVNEDYTWLSGIIYIVSPVTAFWAVSGLELGLHLFLVSGAFVTVIRRTKWALVYLPLLVLNRPEGVIIALALVGSSGAIDFFDKSLDKKEILRNVSIIIAAAAFITVFRMIVFGYPFPNTYYAKAGDAEYRFDQVFDMLLYFLPLTVLFTIGVWQALKNKFQNREFSIAIVLFGLQAIISSMVSPIMNFHFRYMIPFLPFFMMVGFGTLNYVRNKRIIWVIIALSALSLLSPFGGVSRRFTEELKIMDAQNNLTIWLNHMPGIKSVSITDVGRIPYYTDKHYNDIWGLVSEDIAHKGFNPLEEYLRFPDCFVFVGYKSEDKFNLSFGRERLISQCRGMSRTYQYAGMSTPYGADSTRPGYYYIRLLKIQSAVDSLLENFPIMDDIR